MHSPIVKRGTLGAILSGGAGANHDQSITIVLIYSAIAALGLEPK